MSLENKLPTARKVARNKAKDEARLEEYGAHIARLKNLRDESVSLRMTKDDLEKLENVKRFGKVSMKALLAETHHQVAAVEVKQFLEWNKTAGVNEIPSVNSDSEAQSLIKAPSYSIDVLIGQGFSRFHARIIQRKVEEQRKEQGLNDAAPAPTIASQKETTKPAKLTKRMRKIQIKNQVASSLADRAAAASTKPPLGDGDGSEEDNEIDISRKERIEEALQQGWRPEHVSSLNALKAYDKFLKISIPEWEQEQLLLEYLEEFLEDSESDLCKKKFEKMSAAYRSDAEDFTSDFDSISTWFDKREANILIARDAIKLPPEFSEGVGAWPEERFRYLELRNRYAKIDAGVKIKWNTKASREARVKYNAWYEMCCGILLDKETMHEFPAPPITFCTPCRKNRNILGFCEHALEKWYEASDDMEETLRSESRRWHPDRFQKCAPGVKVDMVLKATELFQLIGKLVSVQEREVSTDTAKESRPWGWEE